MKTLERKWYKLNEPEVRMKRGYNLGSSLAEFLCPPPPAPNEPNDTSPLHQALPDSPLDHEHIVTGQQFTFISAGRCGKDIY